MAIEQAIVTHALRFDAVPVAGNGFRSGVSEPGRIIAVSKAMGEILDVVRRSAPTDAPLLIYGEPDTGKKRIAREVHLQSRRRSKAFVHVACGACASRTWPRSSSAAASMARDETANGR